MIIVIYHKLARGVHEGKLFDNHKFKLLEYDDTGSIAEVSYQ